MEWIDAKILPDCWSQHGKSFASGYLLTYNKHGEFEVNQYWQHGEHTGKGWIKGSEGWEKSNGEITHWANVVPPKKILK